MSTFKKIAVSNWGLYQNSHEKKGLEEYAAYLGQLEKLGEKAGIRPDILILREKTMPEEQYEYLLARVVRACKGQSLLVIPHTYEEAAEKMEIPRIHLPFSRFCQSAEEGRLGGKLAGTSVHSVQEAREAAKRKASYVTAGHIFATECKPGVEPRGTGFLEEVCKVCRRGELPVYAIGGIHPWNMQKVKEAGAAGACMMSEYMGLPAC